MGPDRQSEGGPEGGPAAREETVGGPEGDPGSGRGTGASTGREGGGAETAGEPGSGGDGRRRRRGEHTWGETLHEVQETVGDMVGEVLEGVRDVASGRRFPRVDVIRVEGEGYRVLVDLPGVQKEDLEVTTLGGELTVAGRRRPPELPEGSEALRSERGYGRFHRSIRLPAAARVEDVRATLEDGVLVARVPEAAPGDARTVEID